MEPGRICGDRLDGRRAMKQAGAGFQSGQRAGQRRAQQRRRANERARPSQTAWKNRYQFGHKETAMFKFFRSRSSQPVIPDGLTVYAVGDIHGRDDLLHTLLEQIEAREEPPETRRYIFLGDYVDRGPDSRAVIHRLIALSRERSAVFLKGNHEAALLGFLDDARWGPQWAQFGGAETLQSYGVSAPLRDEPDVWEETQAQFREAFPDAHRRFCEALTLSEALGGYFFAHAGVRPGAPLNEQAEDDLLWIRNDFLDDDRSLEKVVVHGHTPHETAYRDHRRLSLDTGAYITGRLTAARLESDSVEIIQAVSPGLDPS